MKLKECNCATPYKHIKGQHHSQYCPLYLRNGTGWAQHVHFCHPLLPGGTKVPQPWFVLHLKQCGVIYVRLDLHPQVDATGEIAGYEIDISPTRSRWYDGDGPLARQQRLIIAEATVWIAQEAASELLQTGWRKDEPRGEGWWLVPLAASARSSED